MNDTSPVVDDRPASGNSTPAVIGAVVAVVVLVLGVWGLTAMKGSPSTPTAAAPATEAPAEAPAEAPPAATEAPPSAAPVAPGACAWTPSADATKQVGTPTTEAVPNAGKTTMVITTNRGVIEVAIDRAKTPCTAASFTHLASKGYFDKTVCHRLTSGGIFVLQCGDPAGNGSGGPGYQFADENLEAESDQEYGRGVVAMANAGPGTNGSQFFINYKAGALQNAYTPFGVVTKGLDIVDKVAAGGNDGSSGDPNDGRPKLPVEIQSVTFK